MKRNALASAALSEYMSSPSAFFPPVSDELPPRDPPAEPPSIELFLLGAERNFAAVSIDTWSAALDSLFAALFAEYIESSPEPPSLVLPEYIPSLPSRPELRLLPEYIPSFPSNPELRRLPP
jgi:hypothetical protein